jgi:hypothetical protein
MVEVYVRVNKKEAMLGLDSHPCRQLIGNTQPSPGRTTPSLKKMTSIGPRAEQFIYQITSQLP